MKYNPQIHHRRSIRLKGYDYSQAGAYFITICCENRQNRFGKIVGASLADAHNVTADDHNITADDRNVTADAHNVTADAHNVTADAHNVTADDHNVTADDHNVTADDHNVTADAHNPTADAHNITADAHNPNTNVQMELNEFGTIAYNEWNKLPERFLNFELDVFQIMPNHMHGIIVLNGNAPTVGAGASPAATVGDIVGAYKSLVANGCLAIYKLKNETMGKLWQRNYYENIIRNEQSYQTISRYIINNPLNWHKDKFHKE